MKRKLLPLLNTYGVIAFFSPIAFAVLGFLGLVSFNLAVSLFFIFYVFLFCYFILNYFQVKNFLSDFLFDIKISPKITVSNMTELEICLNHDFIQDSSSKYKLYIRPEISPAYKLSPSKKEINFPEDFNEDGSLQTKFILKPIKRNDITIQKFWLRINSRDFIFKEGLFTWQCLCFLTDEKVTKVFPNLFISNKLNSAQRFYELGSKKLLNSFTKGKEFESLKKYQRDDHFRHIDWKRSAKHNNLLVKTYSPETNQRISIAVDSSRKMKAPIKERTQLDFAIDAAASLSNLVINFEDELAMLGFSHKVNFSHSHGKGARQQKLVMESLRKVDAGSYDSNYKIFSKWANQQRKRSLLILITSVLSPSNLTELRDGLSQVNKKHFLLLAICKSPSINEVLNMQVGSLTDAYSQAAAYESKLLIEKRLEYFRKAGVNYIYEPAEIMAEKLRKKYIELKLSGAV